MSRTLSQLPGGRDSGAWTGEWGGDRPSGKESVHRLCKGSKSEHHPRRVFKGQCGWGPGTTGRADQAPGRDFPRGDGITCEFHRPSRRRKAHWGGGGGVGKDAHSRPVRRAVQWSRGADDRSRGAGGRTVH